MTLVRILLTLEEIRLLLTALESQLPSPDVKALQTTLKRKLTEL